MRSIIKSSTILIPILTLAVAIQAQDKNNEAITENMTKEVGDPQKCINSSRLARAEVVDEKTIDFILRNGKIYRNILLTNCPIIRDNNRITYRQETSSRLCKGDRISSLETISDRLQSFGLCGLGEFQQIEVKK